MLLLDHLATYKKAYVGGTGALIGTQVSQPATTVLVWLLGLGGITVPDPVRNAIADLMTAALAFLGAAVVNNTESTKIQLPNEK